MLLKYLIKSYRSLIVILEVYCRWYRVYGIPCPFLPGSHGSVKLFKNTTITLHGLPVGFACGFVPSDKSMPLLHRQQVVPARVAGCVSGEGEQGTANTYLEGGDSSKLRMQRCAVCMFHLIYRSLSLSCGPFFGGNPPSLPIPDAAYWFAERSYLFSLDLPCPSNTAYLFSAGSWACWTHFQQLSTASHREIFCFRSLFGSACCICFLNAARCVDDNWLPAKRLKASNQPESRRKVTTTSHIFEFVSPAPDSAPKTGCFWAEVIEVMVIAAKLIASTKEMTLALRISYWYRGRDIIHPIKSRNSRLSCCTHKEEFNDSLQVIWYMSIIVYLISISYIHDSCACIVLVLLATAAPHLWIFGCSSSDPGSAGDRATLVKLHGYFMSLMRFDRTVEV